MITLSTAFNLNAKVKLKNLDDGFKVIKSEWVPLSLLEIPIM